METVTFMAEIFCLVAPLVFGLMAGLIWWRSREVPGKPQFYPTDFPVGPIVLLLDDLEDDNGP